MKKDKSVPALKQQLSTIGFKKINAGAYDIPKSTYEEYLKALIPPVKVIHEDKEWVIVENKNKTYKLVPTRKDINNGEPIYLPHSTIFTHVESLRYE